MFHRSLNHTGAAITTPQTRSEPFWMFPMECTYSCPAVSKDRVYMGCNLNIFYCLNAITGNIMWSYETGAFMCSPAVAGDRVYVASDRGMIYCFNAITGTVIWSTLPIWVNPYIGGIWSSPAVTTDRVYVGCENNKTYCLNASTGSILWNFTTGMAALSSPSVVGGYVYIGGLGYMEGLNYRVGQMYCLDAMNGTLIWNYTMGIDAPSSPAVAGSLVYVGCGYNMFCFNAATGTLVWNYRAGGSILSSPAMMEDRLYVGCYDGNLYCLNASTGNSIWNYTTGDWIFSSPAIAGDYVYIGSFDKKMYCLNATTGDLISSFGTGDRIFSSPAISAGRLYAGSEDGILYCLPMLLSTSPSLNLSIITFQNLEDGHIYQNLVQIIIHATCGGWPIYNAWCVIDQQHTYMMTRVEGTTLSGFYSASPNLANGAHLITIFINDTQGNVVARNITITIDPSFDIQPVVVTLVIAGISIGIGVTASYHHYKYRLRSGRGSKRAKDTYEKKMNAKAYINVEENDKRTRLLTDSDGATNEKSPDNNVKIVQRCTLHKGMISGNVYTCTNCGAMYCADCFKELVDAGDNCWKCKHMFIKNTIRAEEQNELKATEFQGTSTLFDPEIYEKIHDLGLQEEVEQDLLRILKEIPPEKRLQYMQEVFEEDIRDEDPF